ncbi:S-layer homology domain-containing protein [Coleofasciculus sp. FACHB-129]|uniref:S-layer homology domain-containing protein n=1 Tax=Cyanophyceae TaxID=3028117 RepID=UPI0016888C94|nr:S-layer homology domain-containing protein [Coleofasciculus sp. FACHB-129]MBD1896885.1 S-layer homology domain-containing protein [Coleofasciculus sp. FACHB-129]
MTPATGGSRVSASKKKLWYHRLRILLSSMFLGSTILYAAASLATTGASSGNRNASEPAKGSGSMGDALLKTMLGAEALRSNNPPAPSTTRSSSSLPAIRNPAAPGSSVQQPGAVTTPTQLAQASTFPDVQGSWAQTFIEALAEREVIVGFPDGSFRPDEPVTRAQFAAMIRKAFQRPATRQAIDFVDVPANYWGYTAIQEAYRTGFLEGYPNQVFQPNQNIPRVQVLVSLVSGLNLNPTADTASILNGLFQDAGSIPAYARTSVAAAAQNQLVVNYPDVALLNPNQLATRADVAAFIYQALVNAGQAPQIPPTDVAARYVVGYEPVATTPPPPTAEQVAALRQQYRLPAPPIVEQLRRLIGGNSSITTPTAFGADRGQAFIGAGFQERTRNTNKADGVIAAGIGVGDARKAVGVEGVISIYDLFGDDSFEDGGISFKIHRQFANDIAVAVGVENIETFGEPDPGYSTVYGVVSKVFPLGSRTTAGFSPSVTASVGLGGGRFRSVPDIEAGRDSVNPFGSIGVRVAQPISVIAEWSGQDLNVGASIAPFENIPLIITPALADVTGNAGDGARFILGVGYGITF